MAIPVNLAMTAAEFCFCPEFPPKIAWMACQFSSNCDGLSNLPPWLPQGSLLILNDQMPLDSHDPVRIGDELTGCVQALECAGVLLDFQRPDAAGAGELAAYLSKTLPCPVAVTPPYAPDREAAIFLPPLPCHIPLRDWLSPWQGRELWLELALEQEIITLTQEGAWIAPGEFAPSEGLEDKKLHCHYHSAVEEQAVVFRLWRTREDLEALLEEAETLGIRQAVGLYQELGGAGNVRG